MLNNRGNVIVTVVFLILIFAIIFFAMQDTSYYDDLNTEDLNKYANEDTFDFLKEFNFITEENYSDSNIPIVATMSRSNKFTIKDAKINLKGNIEFNCLGTTILFKDPKIEVFNGIYDFNSNSLKGKFKNISANENKIKGECLTKINNIDELVIDEYRATIEENYVSGNVKISDTTYIIEEGNIKLSSFIGKITLSENIKFDGTIYSAKLINDGDITEIKR